MKQNIHPNRVTTTITCACGNTFQSLGEKETLQVDICSACHPFFTGEERFVDKQGRIDKFKQKMAVAEKNKEEREKLAAAKMAKQEANHKQASVEPQSFKQILNQAKSSDAKSAPKAPAKAETATT